MSMNKQLSKEVRFAYQIFQTAAQKASGYKIPSNRRDDNVIIAGGAVRDLHFGHEPRDVDIYYNASSIAAYDFANALKNLDIAKMGREAGYAVVEVIRLSDGSKMGRQGNAGDEEDWGDVSDDAKIVIEAFADRYLHYAQAGYSTTMAVLEAHRHVTTANAVIHQNPRHGQYLNHVIERLQGINTKRSSSAGGQKMGTAHPLKSVEEFRVVFNDGYYIDVELMGVAKSPIDYVMTHFAVKLSRAYYDGAGVHFTSDFMQDATNKTLTVACPVEHARFERLFTYYLPKMKRYFPDFDVRVDLNAMNPSSW